MMPLAQQEALLANRPSSVGAMLKIRAEESGPREAFRYLDGERWVSLTWTETKAAADEVAAALLSLGLQTEDRVAIASGTRIEWILADLGIMSAGGATTTVALLATASAAAIAWVKIERRTEDPLVDLQTLARPEMAATNVSTILIGFAMTAFFVLVPGFLQADGFGFGLSPTSAGFLLLPFSLAMIAAGPAAGALGTKRGRVLPLRIGLLLGASSLAGLAALHANQLVFALWLPVMGVGMAFSLAAIGALVLDHCRPEETGVASGMNTIMRTAGAAIGAQLAAAIVSAHPGTGEGYTIAFAMAAVLLAVALVPTLVLTRRRPASAPAGSQLAPA